MGSSGPPGNINSSYGGSGCPGGGGSGSGGGTGGGLGSLGGGNVENEYEELFGNEIGFYKGNVVFIKRIYKKSIDLTRNVRKELIQVIN